MTKRTARAQRTQAKNGAGPAPGHLVEPMLAGMTTTRQHLLAWVYAHGLAALDELFREEAGALAGPKGRHHPQRTQDLPRSPLHRPTCPGAEKRVTCGRAGPLRS